MRILVGLIEHLGDIVACEPVARYLRLRHPGCALDWAVAAPYRELIDSNPHVDRTLVVTCLQDWARLAASGAHDAVFDLHVEEKPCLPCGFIHAKASGNPAINPRTYFHHGALLEAFAEGAGLPRLSVAPQLHLGPAEAAAADALELPPHFCVIHRVSKVAAKDWPHDRWAAIARLAQKELGLAVVEVGAGDATTLPAPLPGSISLVNRLPVLVSAEVIRRAQVFLGVDSGPGHLANALRVPGVILLGRLPPFESYRPYTGFYASAAPGVHLLRNGRGPVREIAEEEVAEALRAVAAAPAAPRPAPEPMISPAELHARRPACLEAEIIARSDLFDIAWYALHHPEALASGLHPADHYLRDGATAGLDPGPEFSTNWYTETHTDIARVQANPLLRYLTSGRAEGRASQPAHARRQSLWQELREQRRMTAELHAQVLALQDELGMRHRKGGTPRAIPAGPQDHGPVTGLLRRIGGRLRRGFG